MKYTKAEVIHLVGIGFCQPKFYKKNVWRKAKQLMDDVVCPNGLAYPFEFGRGKGKYKSEFDIDDVQNKTIAILTASFRIIVNQE